MAFAVALPGTMPKGILGSYLVLEGEAGGVGSFWQHR